MAIYIFYRYKKCSSSSIASSLPPYSKLLFTTNTNKIVIFWIFKVQTNIQNSDENNFADSLKYGCPSSPKIPKNHKIAIVCNVRCMLKWWKLHVELPLLDHIPLFVLCISNLTPREKNPKGFSARTCAVKLNQCIFVWLLCIFSEFVSYFHSSSSSYSFSNFCTLSFLVFYRIRLPLTVKSSIFKKNCWKDFL